MQIMRRLTLPDKRNRGLPMEYYYCRSLYCLWGIGVWWIFRSEDMSSAIEDMSDIQEVR